MEAPTTSFDHSSLIRHTCSLDHESLYNSIIQEQTSGELKKVTKFSRRQLLLIFSYIYGNFFLAACVSLQAPFFPHEAEKKGATPTQYGLVFGLYEISIIIVSPIVGKLVGRSSPRLWIQLGLIVTGISTIFFGFLDHVPGGWPFITLAFAVRILEGIGAASFTTPSYTATAEEFPQDQATILSLLETSFGLGLICGPTLGSWLYSIGDFVLPFLLLGICLLLGSMLNLAATINQEQIAHDPKQKQAEYMKILTAPGIILDSLCVITSLSFIGYNAATLEPHLRQFELGVMNVGYVFVITGLIYAITTPIWGRLCKHYNTRLLSILGCLLCLGGFAIIGPIPLIKMEPEICIIITALILIGLGTAIKLVAALVGLFQHSINELDMPNNKSTFGVCSSIYHMSTSIGAFFGPSIGGFLLERFGYRSSTYFLFSSELILILSIVSYMLLPKICRLRTILV